MTRFAGIAVAAVLAGHLLLPANAGPFEDGAAAYGSRDFATALQLWQPLADGGDAAAQFNLGILHDQGEGVPQDTAEAARWYRLAAEQGDGPAAFNLAFLYEKGEGVAQDLPEAVKWYRLAGEKGDILAQFRLGLIYAEGKGGVPQDYAEAAKWYELAAKQNHAMSQFNLGTLYANGTGVPRDLGAATEWFDKADTSLMSGESPANCTPRNTPKLEECRRRLPRL